MLYEVTYQLRGQEQTDRVEAPDAATAASTVKDAHGRSEDRFELILVHLVEDQADPAPPSLDANGLGVGS